jgi:Clp amino terminal domain, pathogenicity island component/ClpX C4-type zinc finger
VFERFTDEARRAVVMAQEEARQLNHNYIGAEHILLGLLGVEDGIASRALQQLEVAPDAIRRRVREIIGAGALPASGHIPFTSDAKKALEYSLREALRLGHNYIGTEHILLALVRPDDESIASQVLVELGIEQSRVRQAVMQLLTTGEAAESVPETPRLLEGAAFAAPRLATCSFCGRDLWDVTYYVTGAQAAICQECVEGSHAVVEDATARGAGAGALHLPPQVSGEPPDDRAAVGIVDAFMEVYGAATQAADMRDRPLEDVESLLPAIEEAGRRHPNLGPVSVAISRIRFRTDDIADVRFTLFRFPFEGQAIRDAGTWKVSRDTFCQTLARGGVQCPPREPS